MQLYKKRQILFYRQGDRKLDEVKIVFFFLSKNCKTCNVLTKSKTEKEEEKFYYSDWE